MGAQDSRPEVRSTKAIDVARYANKDNGMFYCLTGKGAGGGISNRISYNNPNNNAGITCFSGTVEPGDNRFKRSPLTPRQKKEVERKSLSQDQTFSCCGGTKRQSMESGGTQIRNSNALELRRTYEEAVSIITTLDICIFTSLTYLID